VSDHPLVATVACSRGGYARYAQAALPAAVYPEVTDDFPPAVDSVAPAFRIATPLVKAPAGVADPVALLGSVAGDPLRERADSIHKSGKGSLTTYADGKTTAVKDLKSDDFWKALNGGACWTGPEERRSPATTETLQASGDDGLPLLISVEGLPAGALVSPLMSKVYRESNLRLAPNRVALHPAEARQYGIEDGGRALLETRYGRVPVAVTLDSSVPPGVVRAGSRSLCGGAARARVVRI
jgi:Molydopterin dinucleotide binding domain